MLLGSSAGTADGRVEHVTLGSVKRLGQSTWGGHGMARQRWGHEARPCCGHMNGIETALEVTRRAWGPSTRGDVDGIDASRTRLGSRRGYPRYHRVALAGPEVLPPFPHT